MAVATNGHAVESSYKRANGQIARPKPRRSWTGWLISTVLRLFTWYSIVSVLFRCPANESLLDSSSPKICRPYFEARNIIAPHLSPYYEAYAAPYVQKVEPYYQTLDKRVIVPASALAKKHGAPRLAQAQKFGQAQWEKTVQPQLFKVNSAVKDQYTKTLAPHVSKFTSAAAPYYKAARENVEEVYHKTLLPAYDTLQPYAYRAYSVSNDFAVTTGIPYAKWAWASGVLFLDRTIWPKLRILYGENVEPQLVRIGERLGRYRDGKRLKAAVEEIEISSSASSVAATLSSAASSISDVAATDFTSSLATPSETLSSLAPSATPLTSEETRQNAKNIVTEDLANWQEKFAKAADQGSDELDERITEITSRAVEKQAGGVGEALIIQLEETVKSSLEPLKSQIIKIISNKGDEESSEEEINTAVRAAGSAVKGKAQAVRAWKQSYDQETNSLISAAADSTFEIIDHIRDLGLQEIGMRWAWTDGITHKDWQKYHALKSQFDEWRQEVEQVAVAHPGLAKARVASEDIEHRAMAIAEDAVKELSRLKETGRWKLSAGDISDDWSTKYMPPAAVAAGAKMAQKIVDAKDAVLGETTTQGKVEALSSAVSSSLSEASASAQGAVSGASSFVGSVVDEASRTIIGSSSIQDEASSVSTSGSSIATEASKSVKTQQGSAKSVVSAASASANSFAQSIVAGGAVTDSAGSSASSAASGISDSASSYASQVSRSVAGGTADENVVSMASRGAGSMADQASSIASIASASILGTSQDSAESMASIASNGAGSVVSEVSSLVADTTPGIVKQASSSLSSLGSAASSTISSGSDGAASSVSSAGSVISGSGSSAASIASSSASSLSKSASSAASQASSSGSSASSSVSKSITSTASDLSPPVSSATASVKKVWGGAMAQHVEERKIIYEDVLDEDFPEDTYSEKIESMASAAGDRFAEITNAVSEALSKPTTTVGAAESITSLASAQYASALSAASIALYGTQQAAGESIVSVASEQYKSAVAAASSAIWGQQAPAYQTVLSQADAAYSTALAQASSAYDSAIGVVNARINIAGTTKHLHEQMILAAKSTYNAATDGAISQYSSAAATASSVIYGPPPGALESISAVASSRLAEGLALASASYSSVLSAYGPTPTPAAKRYLDQAQAQYYAGIGIAHERFSSFVAQASAVVAPTVTPAYQSLYSKASAGVVGSSTGYLESAVSAAQSQYSAASSMASSNLGAIVASLSSVSSGAMPSQSLAAAASSRYSVAMAAASKSLASASSAASLAVYGSTTGVVESATSAAIDGAQAAVSQVSEGAEALSSIASENWEALITKASLQIYGAPTPVFQDLYSQAGEYADFATSQAGEYAAQATDAAAAQYLALQSLFSELVVGKEPDFAESLSARFSSAYYTGAPAMLSSASSVAAEGYASASSVASVAYDSASSVVSSVFTPPPALENALDAATAQLDAAVSAASLQLYGSTTGYFESASSAASSAYSAASSAASVAAYGSTTGYAEAASSSIAAAASSAQAAILEAIYGTETPAYATATDYIAETYSPATEVVAENVSAASAAVSKAIYGPEQGTVESAQARLSQAVESARAKLAEYAAAAGDGAAEVVQKASEGVENFASSVSSVVASEPSAKDEL